jgi:hypothetical protein
MRAIALLLFILFPLGEKAFAQNGSTKTKVVYSLCWVTSSDCPKKCEVEIQKGTKVALGSYVKVYDGERLITEGYILKHIRGGIYIFKDKEDSKNPKIYGGCADDGTYSIDMANKNIWGCMDESGS